MRWSFPPAAFLLLISSSGFHRAFAFNISPDLPHGEGSNLRPLGHTPQPGAFRASIPFLHGMGVPPPADDEPFIPGGPPHRHAMMGGPPPPPMGHPFLGHPPHPGMMGPPHAFLHEPLPPNAEGGPRRGGMPPGMNGPPPPAPLPPPGPIPGMMGPIYDEVVEHPMQGPGPGFWQNKLDNLSEGGDSRAPFEVPRDFIDNAPQSEGRPHRPMEEPNNNNNNPSRSRGTNPARKPHPNDQATRGGGNAKGRSEMRVNTPRNDHQEKTGGGNRPASKAGSNHRGGHGDYANNQVRKNRKNPNRWPYNLHNPSVQQQKSNNNNNNNDPNAYVPMEDPNGASGGGGSSGITGGGGVRQNHRQRPQPAYRPPVQYRNDGNRPPVQYRNGGNPNEYMPMGDPNMSSTSLNMGDNFGPPPTSRSQRPRRSPPPPPQSHNSVQYGRRGGDPNEYVPMADPNGSGDSGRSSFGGGLRDTNNYEMPMMERYNDDDYYDDSYNPRYHDDSMMMDGYGIMEEPYNYNDEYDNFNLHPPMDEYDHFMHHFNNNEPPLPPPLPPTEFYQRESIPPPPPQFEREWYRYGDGPSDPMMRLDDGIDGYLDHY